MSTENLIGGADAYTDLAQVVQAPETDTPEATPSVVASAIASFNASWLTAKQGC